MCFSFSFFSFLCKSFSFKSSHLGALFLYVTLFGFSWVIYGAFVWSHHYFFFSYG